MGYRDFRTGVSDAGTFIGLMFSLVIWAFLAVVALVAGAVALVVYVVRLARAKW